MYTKNLILDIPNSSEYISKDFAFAGSVGITELIKFNNRFQLSLSEMLFTEILTINSGFFPSLGFIIRPTLHIKMRDVAEIKLSTNYSQYFSNSNDRYMNWTPNSLGISIGIGR